MAAKPTPKNLKIKIPWMVLISFFLFTVGILILGRVYYRSQATKTNKDAQETLTAISLLKIRQIDQWHIERLVNANQILYNNPLLKSLEHYIKNQNQPETEADIKKWTKYMSERLDYSGAFIYDTLLNPRLATTQSGTELTGITKIASVEALKDVKVRMTDLYMNGTLGKPAIDLVIPLVSNYKKQSRPFGVIVLRIDPAKTLFPLIQSWPSPSKSAETLLIRKDGDSVLYLNDLRHIQNTALNLKLPLTNEELPAAKAVNGFTGVVEGVDYRKVPVVGYVSSIPDLSWFLVAKVDKEEIHAPLKEFSLISVIVTVLLIVIVASVLLFWIRNQLLIESRENLRNELERKQIDEALIISETRYRRLFEAARDGILILEAETGRIVDMNPYLAEMLGITCDQFLKKSIWEIGFFNDIAANKDKFLELQQKGYVRYEDLPLETADGRKFNVEFVSNVYQVSGYPVIQCNIRDITKRKEMVDELNKQNSMINALLANLQIGVYMIEVPSGIPLLANESSFNLLGRGILPEANSDTIAKVYDLYKAGTDIPYPNEELPLIVAMSGVSKHVDDMEVKKPDGTRTSLEVFGSPIRDNSGNIWASLVSFQDITERKQAELKLLHARHNLLEAERIGHTGSWEYDVATDTASWSNNMFRLFDVDPELSTELVFKHFVDNLVHPDDRAEVLSIFSDALLGKRPYDLEYRVIRKNGNIRFIHAIAETLRDEHGMATRMIGIVEDITTRKHAEEEIKTKVAELERFNRLSVGREMRMIELKQKINDLSAQLKLPHPYALDYLKSTNDIVDIGKKVT
jgi:PAS domain S-box-containing protein